MKKLRYNSLLLGGILLMASCSNSEYELQTLVPENVHKIIYVNNSGKQEMNMNTVETTPVFSLRIVKAGSDPSLVANVKVSTMTQTEIDELYNEIEGTQYKLVPSSMYSYAATEATFEAGEVAKRVDITFRSDLLYAEMQLNKGTQYVLPVKVTSDQDSINMYKNHSLVLLDVKKPLISFKLEDMPTAMIYKELEVNVKTDLKNISASKWDFTCTLSDDKKDELVSKYNEEHQTNYLPLPSSAYELGDVVFVPGASEGVMKMKVSRTPLTSDKAYLLPLKLTGTSQEGFDLGEKLCYMAVDNPKYGTIDCDRSKWKIVLCNSDEKNTGTGGDRDGAASIFDSNHNTYWHSAWSGSMQSGVQDPDKFVGQRQLPITIVAEMNEPIIVYSIGLHQRSDLNNADAKTVEYYTSNDPKFILGGEEDYSPIVKNDWTYVLKGEYKKISGGQWNIITPEVLQKKVKGHLLKIKFTESHRGGVLCNAAEIYVKRLAAIDGEPID